ncbi:hypothetical protein [Streptomyces sp. BA2]|uniref:hypothetical protein n=1 Tax=Streptomyces sp. BA2 TaxID=436595 RepID=UPI001F386C6A|nr:hypothetical protein [Streptomyces sp. BA2]
MYCLNTAANTYDRYEWSGTKRPWFGDTPDGQGKIVGTSSADPGLFGHWAIPWNTVDGTLCVDTSHVYLFNGTNCIYYTLEATGSFTDRTPETDDVTNPMPISELFGYGGAFALNKVEAAFFTADKKKKIWFFGDNWCYLIDATTHKPEDGFTSGAQPISNQWSNLPNDLKNGLTWAAPILDGTSGNVQDSAHLVTGTNWAPVIPSAKTANLALYTDPNNNDNGNDFSVPTDVTTITLELWGPGGNGGSGGAGYGYAYGHPGGTGGDGGCGAYIRKVISPAPSSLTLHLGTPGTCTFYGSSLIAAGGGAGGGGGGGDYGYQSGSAGDGGSGGGGDGGSGGSASGRFAGGGGNGGSGGNGAGGSQGSGGRGAAGGGGGGGGGAGAGLLRTDGGGGGGGSAGTGSGSGGGGGGGSQGLSMADGAVLKPCADGSPRTPYTQFCAGVGEGGTGGTGGAGDQGLDNPGSNGGVGGNGAARITW